MHHIPRRLAAALALVTAVLGSAASDRALALDPGDLLISEFRTSGANTNDEYVEIYNNTGVAITLSDAVLVVADGNTVNASSLPSVTLPARRTFLITRSGAGNYTLGAYANGNETFGSLLANSAGVKLRDSVTEATIDQVSTSPTTFGTAPNDVSPEGTRLRNAGVGSADAQQYAYVRKLRNSGTPSAGRPLDTDSNNSDFDTVSTDSAPATGVGIFGTPNPQNLASPRQRNASIAVDLLDGAPNPNTAPNRTYAPAQDPDNAGPGVGTLRIRRKLTNNTNGTLTDLRIRVVDITTLRSDGDAPGQARIRLLGSANTSAQCPAPCIGAVPQAAGGLLTATDDPATPADETVGGFGLYSSATVRLVDLTSGGLAPGESTNVEFRLGVERAGAFRFFFNLET